MSDNRICGCGHDAILHHEGQCWGGVPVGDMNGVPCSCRRFWVYTGDNISGTPQYVYQGVEALDD